MILESKIFNDIDNGVNAVFVISEEQKDGMKEIFPNFPQERVIVAPNGINVEKFKPREKDLATVLKEQITDADIIWPAAKPDCANIKKTIVFVGKFAEWKRQAALLNAMAE